MISNDFIIGVNFDNPVDPFNFSIAIYKVDGDGQVTKIASNAISEEQRGDRLVNNGKWFGLQNNNSFVFRAVYHFDLPQRFVLGQHLFSYTRGRLVV